jgi:hypothetical protein
MQQHQRVYAAQFSRPCLHLAALQCMSSLSACCGLSRDCCITLVALCVSGDELKEKQVEVREAAKEARDVARENQAVLRQVSQAEAAIGEAERDVQQVRWTELHRPACASRVVQQHVWGRGWPLCCRACARVPCATEIGWQRVAHLASVEQGVIELRTAV